MSLHRFWWVGRDEDSIAPIMIMDGRLSISIDEIIEGTRRPPSGIIVGEFWFDEDNLAVLRPYSWAREAIEAFDDVDIDERNPLSDIVLEPETKEYIMPEQSKTAWLAMVDGEYADGYYSFYVAYGDTREEALQQVNENLKSVSAEICFVQMLRMNGHFEEVKNIGAKIIGDELAILAKFLQLLEGLQTDEQQDEN